MIFRLMKPLANLYSWLLFKKDRYRLKKLMDAGMKIGKNVYIMEDVEFDLNYPYLIEIGDNCRISKGVRILAHDATTFRDLGITQIKPVRILEGTFIAERVIILPGVTIGPRALITAGSVVNRDVGEDKAVAGNPARPYANFSELLEKYSRLAAQYPVFKKEQIESGELTTQNLLHALHENPMAFIRGVPQKDPFYVNIDFGQVRVNAVRAFQNLIEMEKMQTD
jgi:carbonic anhydrase/acetyltransferase-like protein (isoleucine patch superfamily)